MSEDKKDKPDTDTGINKISKESSEITFENMQKLCNTNEYEIAGVKYKRKILKPKELVKLYKLQDELEKIRDPEKRMENIHQEALVCLTNQDGSQITDKQWEDTDAVMMEIVIGACLLISRGFRKI